MRFETNSFGFSPKLVGVLHVPRWERLPLLRIHLSLSSASASQSPTGTLSTLRPFLQTKIIWEI